MVYPLSISALVSRAARAGAAGGAGAAAAARPRPARPAARPPRAARAAGKKTAAHKLARSIHTQFSKQTSVLSRQTRARAVCLV